MSTYSEINEADSNIDSTHIVTQNSVPHTHTKKQPSTPKSLEITFSKATWLDRWGPPIGSLTFGILECVNASVNSPSDVAFKNAFYRTIWGTFYGGVVGNLFPMAAPALICSMPIYWWLKKE